MSNRMLIDATHPEETRVVVLRGNRVEEFDFEAADRQQLRGNIYLAKVTRVEPSLQAAFVDYGGNRHGFLAFSEIHPDYYQIPYADRQALLQEQAREEAEQAAEEAELDSAAEAASDAAETAREAAEEASSAWDDAEAPPERGADASERAEELAPEPQKAAPAESAEALQEPDTWASETPAPVAAPAMTADVSSDMVAETPREASESAGSFASLSPEGDSESVPARSAGGNVDEVDTDRYGDDAEMVESVGAEDALEEVPERRKPRPRQYKIQEVIKRRQVMLVQVVKEERGNKGAALTTYLSLAGRYSVLMPNTGRGGGISRKITNPADRKRLKAIASELDVPEGMGVILRTAGANRTKAEVKRDFEYLLRLWENVRELTLRSTAPKLVYEEGSLIKRSIRDLYSKEIDQIIVAGDDAYREAKDFMRMLTPSHARHVQVYKEDTPIFARNGVEAQLDAMFSPQVTLRSGGYIVINQTEALVSIDVNSGRSTREHSIEDTALNTNLEAAEEIARQLRLRDLAGLIVIDFIDMEEKRNNRSVERKLKDCLRADRARIQVGRISHFGLLEMSRQRIRTGVLESSVVPCPHCRGTGQVRSIASLSLQILRALEDQLLRNSGYHLFVHTRPEAALYVLNQKRQHLAQLESRFGIAITISGEPPEDGGGYAIERGAPAEDRAERPILATAEMPPLPDEEEAEDEDIEARRDEETETEEGRDRRRRRRRRRGNGDDRHERHQAAESEVEPESEAEEAEEELEPGREAEADASGQDQRRRRRGRRGGRRRGRGREQGDSNGNGETVRDQPGGEPAYAHDEGGGEATPYSETAGEWAGAELSTGTSVASVSERPEPTAFDEPLDSSPTLDDAEPAAATVDASGTARDMAESAREDAEPAAVEAAPEIEVDTAVAAEPASPQPTARDAAPAEETAPADEPAPPPPEDDRPKRSGWWSRKSSFF